MPAVASAVLAAAADAVAGQRPAAVAEATTVDEERVAVGAAIPEVLAEAAKGDKEHGTLARALFEALVECTSRDSESADAHHGRGTNTAASALSCEWGSTAAKTNSVI